MTSVLPQVKHEHYNSERWFECATETPNANHPVLSHAYISPSCCLAQAGTLLSNPTQSLNFIPPSGLIQASTHEAAQCNETRQQHNINRKNSKETHHNITGTFYLFIVKAKVDTTLGLLQAVGRVSREAGGEPFQGPGIWRARKSAARMRRQRPQPRGRCLHFEQPRTIDCNCRSRSDFARSVSWTRTSWTVHTLGSPGAAGAAPAPGPGAAATRAATTAPAAAASAPAAAAPSWAPRITKAAAAATAAAARAPRSSFGPFFLQALFFAAGFFSTAGCSWESESSWQTSNPRDSGSPIH